VLRDASTVQQLLDGLLAALEEVKQSVLDREPLDAVVGLLRADRAAGNAVVPAPRPVGVTRGNAPRGMRLRDRLVWAKSSGEPIALQFRSGRRATVRVIDVVQRGSATMLLGEDVETDVAMALRLDEIDRVIDAPDDAPAGADRTPYSPRPGEPAPAGHLPCPCGSGEKYRRCCRKVS